MTKSNATRQREYAARMKARGLVKISVWIHKAAVARLKAFADKLRGEG